MRLPALLLCLLFAGCVSLKAHRATLTECAGWKDAALMWRDLYESERMHAESAEKNVWELSKPGKVRL